MSGSIDSIIASPTPVDVLGQYQKWAQLGQAQAQTGQIGAQTGLLGAQTQQTQTAADLAKLQLAKTGYLYGAIGIPGTGPSGGAPGTSGVAGPGLGASVPEPAGAPGAAAGGAGGAPAGGAASPGGSYPGQIGMQYFGVPMPALLAVGAIGAPDQGAQVKSALETRRQAIFSGVSTAPPGDYPAAMMNLYRAGWITPQQAQDAIQHPEGRARILQATQTPEAYQSMLNSQLGMGVQPNLQTGSPEISPVAVGAKGATAAATAGGQAQFETMQLTVPDPQHPNQWHTITTTKAIGAQMLANGGGARVASVGDKYNPNVTIDLPTYVQRQTGLENAGGGPSTRSTGSSATGNGQFTDATWAQTVATAKPAWAAGMTPAQIIAARSDPSHPEYMAQMQAAFGQQNAQQLQAAGVPVNTYTLAMAHQFGAAGAQKIMSASPGTPMSQVVGSDVMRANPQFAKMTTDQVSQNAIAHYGLNQVDTSAPYTSATVTPSTPSSPPGSIAGPPVLTPAQTLAQQQIGGAVSADRKEVDSAVAAAQAGQAGNAILLQTRALIPQINAGSGAEWRQAVQNWAATYTPEFAQKMGAFFSPSTFDPSKAGATQEAVKFMLQNAGAQEKATLGANGGYQAIQLYQNANPNISMQPTAIHDMLNVLGIAHQRSIDYGTGANQFFQAQQQKVLDGSGKYTSLAAYQKQFLADNPPQVYVAAAEAANGHPFADWSKGLKPTQAMRALEIAGRFDPTVKIMDPQGRLRSPGAPAPQ